VSRGRKLRAINPVWRRRVRGGVVVALLAATSVAAFLQAGTVRDGLVADTTYSSDALVHATLGPELTTEDTLAPATGTRYLELASVVDRQLLADGTVDAVTIWAPDGTVLFADDAARVGQEVRSMRPTVLAVLGDQARSDVLRGVLRTFVPLDLGDTVAVAVELDRSFDPIRAASDPWRLLGLIAGAMALLATLLLVRTFTRYGRRAEGFDRDTLSSAVAARRKAERDRRAAEERRDELETEINAMREAVRQAQAREREASRAATDAPRLREHLASAAEDLRRSEDEAAALRAQLARAEAAAEAEGSQERDQLDSARAEVQRLENARASVAERAAKAEEEVARLTARLEERQAHPDVEAELETARLDADAARRAHEEQRTRAELAERRMREQSEELEGLRATVRDLERRPDLSARMDAATGALEIAREQIRALTARADEAEAEATRLRSGSDERLAALSAELEEARSGLAATGSELGEVRSELAATHAELDARLAELQRAQTENAGLHEELEALRRQTEAAGEVIAGEKAELTQAMSQMKALSARAEAAEGAEATLERERLATASDLDQVRRELAAARAELERRPDLTPALQEAVEALEQSQAEARFARAQVEVAREASAARDAELAALRDERSVLGAELVRVRGTLERTEAALAEATSTSQELADRLAALEASEVQQDQDADRIPSLEAEIDTLRADLEESRRHAREQQGSADRRLAELEAEVARIAELELQLADAEERARRAGEPSGDALQSPDEALEAPPEEPAEDETPFLRAIAPIDPAEKPEAPVEPAESLTVNGSRPPAGVATTIEVDELVRRQVQESWSDRGRMMSIYAEPVTVDAVPEHIEGILGALLERSIERTSVGNRLVIHVEREGDGALLSVEDGRPATEEAMSPEAGRLAAICGGWASVEAHPGGGAIFRVWVPPVAPVVETAQPA